MTVEIINENTTDGLVLETGTWLISKDVFIANDQDAIFAKSESIPIEFQIFGSLSSERKSGVHVHGNLSVYLDAGASVIGEQCGINVAPTKLNEGSYTSVVNAGYIAGQTAILAKTRDLFVRNSGELNGDFGYGVWHRGEQTEIYNSGTIFGEFYGLRIRGDLTLVNSGHIESGVLVRAGAARIENNGFITGEVITGEGHDYVDTSKGSITGGISTGAGSDTIIGSGSRLDVQGGAGDDCYRMIGGAFSIQERARQGDDWVYISANYTLPTNVEGVRLTGSGDYFARGNAGRNAVEGNDGNNHLSGFEGNDILFGGGGRDYIDGGSGRDTISFLGNDVVLVVDLMKGYAYSESSGRDRLVSIENIITSNSDDVLIGSNGSNVLNPKNGDSVLTGNGGKDFFVFSGSSEGDHVVTDFTEGVDILRIFRGQGAWQSYDTLSDHMRQVGDDVVISARAFDEAMETITIEHMRLSDLTADDFRFVS